MRAAKELDVLRRLKYRDRQVIESFELASGTVIDLAAPCTVIGGRNGTGKSRLLREVAERQGESALLIDLHYLAEHALSVLRRGAEYNAMAEAAGPFGPSAEIRGYVENIVNRDYESLEWFALEIETEDTELDERFKWAGDSPVFPYLRAAYKGVGYTSPHMGLGEFSANLLFWILEHYKEERGLLILLDEPDAFLPPVGVASLLPSLFKLCEDRSWRLIISTHSEEMIALAAEHNSFALLSLNGDGETLATHSADDSSVVLDVLSRPPVDIVLFAEDEAAVALGLALIEHVDPVLRRRVAIVWGKGEGYLEAVRPKLPKARGVDVRIGFLYDGDQQGKTVKAPDDRWPAVFLPTADDPDTLLRNEFSDAPERLAIRLGVGEERMRRVLRRLEGKDKHDWLDVFGLEFGRQQLLAAITSEWAMLHPEHAAAFVDELRSALH